VKELRITAAVEAAMREHAAACYPDEACGMLVERGGALEAVRVTNIQNERHAQDPEHYPRTARIAYSMGPEAVPILLDAERGKLTLVAFFHSHPEHEAYFSEEDKISALGGWDEPNYPDAGQIVFSVREGQVRYAKAFAWDEAARDFVEVPLLVA
jgi:[CysO sulfur-carrier protein]-S-L-cysteine hydrolase